MEEGSLYYMAYVEVSEWHDTIVASNFIKKLHNHSHQKRFIYEDDDSFVVQINYKPWNIPFTK